MAELLIRDAQPGQRVVRLDQPCVFGRGESCGVPLSGAGVSRNHGRFAVDDQGRWWVEDLGSRNGIHVNGRQVSRRLLASGDTLSVGDALMTFLATGGDARGLTNQVTMADGADFEPVLERSALAAAPVEARRLSLLCEISCQLLGQGNVGGIVEASCSALLASLEGGVAVIGLTCDPLREPDLLFVRPSTIPTGDVTLSLSVVKRSIECKRSILVADTRSDEHLRMAHSIVEGGIRSVLCVPITNAEKATGFIYVDARGRGRRYDEQDLDFAAALGALVGTAVEVARLHEAEVAKQRMDADLAAARRVQQAIMPASWPLVPGWGIAGCHRTCREVGGDYYDAIVTPRGLWLIVADVAGKGTQAALLASSFHAAVQALIEQCLSPVDLLNRINQLLMRRQVVSSFITCLVVLIPADGSDLVLATAGHPPAVLIRATGEPQLLKVEPGFMLGVFGDLQCIDQKYPALLPGEGLALYSDGLTEAMDAERSLFGEDRLLDALAGHPFDAAAAVAAIEQTVAQFRGTGEQSDDLTVLVCRYAGPA